MSAIFTDALHYWMEIVTGSGETATSNFIQVVDFTTFDGSEDETTWSPKLKDKKTAPEYVTGSKYSIDLEAMVKTDSTFSTWCEEHEGQKNVAVNIIRVYTWKSATGGGCSAKRAPFQLSLKDMDGAAEEGLMHTGTLRRESDWVSGTFNETTPAFTTTAG